MTVQSITELAALIRQGLAEDKRIAQAAHERDPGPWTAKIDPAGSGWEAGMLVNADGDDLWDCEASNSLCMSDTAAVHAARHDPATVLRDVAGRRPLLDEVLGWGHYEVEDAWYSCPASEAYRKVVHQSPYPCECGRDARALTVLQHLAQPYQEAGQ